MRDIESIRAILLVRIPPTTSESTERSTPPVEILVRVDAESASLVKMSDKDREKQSIQIGETLSQQLYRVHNYRYSPFDLDAEVRIFNCPATLVFLDRQRPVPGWFEYWNERGRSFPHGKRREGHRGEKLP